MQVRDHGARVSQPINHAEVTKNESLVGILLPCLIKTGN